LHAIGLAIASAWLGLVAHARADELGDLKTQVDDLQRKIAQLEKRARTARSAPIGVAPASSRRRSTTLAMTSAPSVCV